MGSLIGKRLFGHWRCLMNQAGVNKANRGNDALYATVTYRGLISGLTVVLRELPICGATTCAPRSSVPRLAEAIEATVQVHH